MKTLVNESEYLTAKGKLDANDNAAHEWLKQNKTNCIPREVYSKFPFTNEVDNDLRSAVEVYEFVNDPPQKYLLYINEEKKEATTWTGQSLGKVFFGREYRSNLGDKRIYVTIHAINGKKYAGNYYKSAGDYARIKMIK